jgi:hypothetical protein
VPGEFAISAGQDGTDSTRTQGIKREKKFRSNFGPIQEGVCATFSAVSDTRCGTYLIFTAFLTAECSTVELPGIIAIFICLRGGCKPNAGDMGDTTESKSSIFDASFPRIHASHDLDI